MLEFFARDMPIFFCMLMDHVQLPLAFSLGMTPAQIALVISGIAVIFGITRWRKNTLDRKRQIPEIPATPVRKATSMGNFNAEIAALLADVEETARRLTAQIDNRYTRLEQLVAEADEKIRKLEALSRAQQTTTMPRPADLPPLAPAPSPSNEMIHRSASESTKPKAAEPLMAAKVDAQKILSRLRHERGAPPATEDPAYQPIYKLADGGKSAREIAQQLGRQPGEVELILALRGR